VSPVSDLLVQPFTYFAMPTGWNIQSRYPIGELDRSNLDVLVANTPFVASCTPDVMQRRHVLAVELEALAINPHEVLHPLLKQLESFFVVPEQPVVSIDVSWQTWRPGIEVRRHYPAWSLFHVRCPLPLTYVGTQKLSQVCLAVDGIDRIGCDYFESDVLEVLVADSYLSQANAVLCGVLTALGRLFPVDGALPAHSPLHHAALTVATARSGMPIVRHIRDEHPTWAIITDIITSGGRPTLIQLDKTRLVAAAHLGMEPYGRATSNPRWSDVCYTLES